MLLTLTVGEGSLLRAALGPKTRASLASLGLFALWSNCIDIFSGLSCETELQEGKHVRADQSMSRASIFHALELGICIEEVCGSDEWQISLYEEWTTFDRSAWKHEDTVIFLLIGSELPWTTSWPSHLGTMEYAWHIVIFYSNGTNSWFFTGEHTSLLIGFLPVCSNRLSLLSCLWLSKQSDFATDPWTLAGPGTLPSFLDIDV